MPSVSVIVNNFNDTERIVRCLRSLRNSDYDDFETIVVDCCTKDVENHVKAIDPLARVLHLELDVGPCVQRNMGVALAEPSSRYLGFLDNDTAIDSKCIGKVVEAMEGDKTIGIAQPTTLTFADRPEIDSTGGTLDILANPRRLREVSPFGKKDVVEVPYAESCIMFLRKKIVDELPELQKPFDPHYFVHWEDIDVSWTVWSLGLRVVNVRSALAYHERRLSGKLSRLPKRLIFLNSRNRLMTVIKHADIAYLTRYLSALLLLECLKAGILLFVRSDHAIATARGFLWNVRNFECAYKKRVRLMNLRRIEKDPFLSLLESPNLLRLRKSFREHYGKSAV